MDVVKIAMANAAGDGPNQDLARGGVVDLDLFDRERLFRRAKNGSLDFHLSRFPQGASSEVYKKARGAGQRRDVEVASPMIGPAADVARGGPAAKSAYCQVKETIRGIFGEIMMPPSRVALEISGGLARIKSINSPRHNAMDLQFCNELADAAMRCSTAPELKAVLLAAEGDVFCVGGDIKEFVANRERLHEHVLGSAAQFHVAVTRLHRLPAPR